MSTIIDIPATSYIIDDGAHELPARPAGLETSLYLENGALRVYARRGGDTIAKAEIIAETSEITPTRGTDIDEADWVYLEAFARVIDAELWGLIQWTLGSSETLGALNDHFSTP